MQIKVFSDGSSLSMDYNFIGIRKVSYDALYHGLYLDMNNKECYVRLNAFQAKQVTDQLIKTEI